MGTLYYSAAQYPIRIDDVTLTSLRVVIERRLDAGVGLTLSWSEAGFGRSTVWLHPTIPLRVHVDDPVAIAPDADAIDAMANEVEQSGGIVLPPDDEFWLREPPQGTTAR
ncbi:hypothetical protein ACFPER_05805 [Agromyces aurantiacus]|uniref:DUF7882 domain-containing protein n=1 Tax=Agromyces aurantiacus TaxID=165814 RepID=A0ABV9R3Y3_9MICO|nr:hypothetical protein [Agromyces aurantiacus]MBM7502973.1 hypothetical protein [Agromyces aurantiacus]